MFKPATKKTKEIFIKTNKNRTAYTTMWSSTLTDDSNYAYYLWHGWTGECEITLTDLIMVVFIFKTI